MALIMVNQAQSSFIDKAIERSELETEYDAKRAANIVFRIMRDMMRNKTSDRIEQDLKDNAPESEQDVVELWHDPNVMVAFFSRISPRKICTLNPEHSCCVCEKKVHCPKAFP